MKRIAFFAFVSTMLGLSAQAVGCPGCAAQTFCVLPGGALWGGMVGVVLIVLTGFLKHPFVSWAGVTDRPLLRSVQASVLSGSSLGVCGLVVYSMAWQIPLLLPAWFLGAIVASIFIERGWLNRRGGGAARGIRVVPLVVGNVVVAIALIALLIAMHSFGYGTMQQAIRAKRLLPPYEPWIALASAGFIAFAFLRPGKTEDIRDRIQQHGFEVIMSPAAEECVAMAKDVTPSSSADT
ncbi:MAG: hypothetical protein QM770_11610 [Tepidisphaeraceae bacterium]